MNEQPYLEHRLEPHMAADLLELRQPLVKQGGDALEFGVALFQLVEGPCRAAIAMLPAQPRDWPRAERILLPRGDDQVGILAPERLGGLLELPIDGGERLEHLRLRHLAPVAAERARQGGIDGDAVDA